MERPTPPKQQITGGKQQKHENTEGKQRHERNGRIPARGLVERAGPWRLQEDGYRGGL